MSNKVTPAAFVRLFIDAFVELDLNAFTRNVLGAVPRVGDSWQEYNFAIFQDAGRSLSRLSSEHVEAIIALAQDLRR